MATVVILTAVIYNHLFQYQAKTEPVFVTESVTVDKWHAAWREPIRTKAALHPNLQQFSTLAGSDPVVSFGWSQSFAELAREKKGILPASQQVFAIGPFLGETITLDKWYAAWCEPVREKPGLLTGTQRFFSANFSPVVNFDWHQPFATPPKSKISLRVDLQRFTAFVKADPFPEAVLESKWHQPWSEPVRKKPPLRIAPETAVVPFTLPYAVVSFGWYTPQTELPPRAKPGLGAQYQPFFTLQRYADITGILAALETKDIFLGGARWFRAPVTGLVGVIEQEFRGISGVIEQRAGNDDIGIVPIARALVSIRMI